MLPVTKFIINSKKLLELFNKFLIRGLNFNNLLKKN